jgi:uncharacterized protein (DUF433 family)
MKLKISKPPVAWRGDPFAHHRDRVRRPQAVQAWNSSILKRIVEPCNEAVHSIRYPTPTLKLFRSALRQCPSISMDNDIMQGQPCIAGTRIPVRAVLRALEQYGSISKVRECYPHLTSEQVEDALYFSQAVLELPNGVDEATIAVG